MRYRAAAICSLLYAARVRSLAREEEEDDDDDVNGARCSTRLLARDPFIVAYPRRNKKQPLCTRIQWALRALSLAPRILLRVFSFFSGFFRIFFD